MSKYIEARGPIFRHPPFRAGRQHDGDRPVLRREKFVLQVRTPARAAFLLLAAPSNSRWTPPGIYRRYGLTVPINWYD